MDYGLKGKAALVTGAASGIGRATAQLFARDGARVVASDVNAEAGAAVVAELTAAGADARFVAADVTDGGALGAAVGRSRRGLRAPGLRGELRRRRWRARVDARVPRGRVRPDRRDQPARDWLAMRAEIDAMLKSGGGAIVNVSSTLGLRGSPFAAPYSASKHAVLGLTRTAALEYAPMGIRINAVCPGAIDTPMMDATFERFPGFRETLTSFVPMGRMGGPEEVAGAIAWLSSDAASFVTGEALTVEGGLLSR